MDTMNKFLFLCTVYEYVAEKESEERNERRRSSGRVNPYLSGRLQKGRFIKDFEDLKQHPQAFYENFHMTAEMFDSLFCQVEEHLKAKRNTQRDRITPKEKFAAVIEYLASGSLQRHIASVYRISKQHFGTIIDDVCEAICLVLKSSIVACNKENFVQWANDFHAQWQFPNCVGAIDGKHVSLTAPPNAGSLFYNYKGFHSIVLMAVADASYKFSFVEVGAYGSEGDSHVFSASNFGKGVLNDTLEFPEDATVNGVKLPFFFVADDAFPLCKRIMKPYGGKNQLSSEQLIFNNRLSRARRCVENAFGILCAKWLCLKRTMFCSPDRAQKIVMACCYLHNHLMQTKRSSYCPLQYADSLDTHGTIIEGEWRKQIMQNTDSLFGSTINAYRGRQTDVSKNIRDQLKIYVNSEVGSVPWQS